MPQQARVTSLDVLEAFRADLIVYLSRARPVLEEVSADMVRTRSWIENDQRTYWENQMRRRSKDLEAAQQALFSARVGTFTQETAAEQMAVHRARRTVEEAQTKLRVVKKWTREFDGRVQPLVKQMEKLQTLLSTDMAHAVIYLTQTLNTLSAYAEAHPPPAPAPAQPAGPGDGIMTGSGNQGRPAAGQASSAAENAGGPRS